VPETDYASLIIQVFWIIFFVLILTGANQRIQIKIWSIDVRNKLRIIKRYLDEDRVKIEARLMNLGLETPSILVKKVVEHFTIEPVSVEPTDIIKRMNHLYRLSEESVRNMVREYVPNIGDYERSLVESSLAILSVINQAYKIIRHYLLMSEKENNWILLMQLQLIMPQIMRIIETYHESIDSFLTGKPIGDGAGPYVAHLLIENGKVVSKRVIEETSVTEIWMDDRRIYVVKAEGPGSNVGKPGLVISKLIEELKGNVDLVITIDAALKLEGEDVGEIAEGVGAAIGDPGPEKIAIERATTQYNIPLKALVIKMGLDDAINTMRKEIYEACVRAYEYVRRMITSNTRSYATIIVAGIGNTMGVPH